MAQSGIDILKIQNMCKNYDQEKLLYVLQEQIEN